MRRQAVRKTARVLLAIASVAVRVGALGATPDASAEAWRYTDERGVVHFTDQPAKVPERYQEQLESFEIEQGRKSPPQGSPPTAEARGEPPTPEPRELSAFEERLLAQAQGHLDVAEMQALAGWLQTWGVAFVLSGIPCGLVVLACFVHTLLRRRFVWTLVNFFFGAFSVPFYILLRLDPLGVPARIGVLLLWCAPIVVGTLSMVSLAGRIGMSSA